MKNIKIKETYLLMLIVFGLISLSLYTTYALFTASTEIKNVVDFTVDLTTDSNIIEYEMVTIPAGESKIIEVNITNSHASTLYYGAWYKMVDPAEKSDDIQLGIYTEQNSTPGSGTIPANSTLSILVGVSNNTASDIIINIGVAASLTEELNLSEGRKRITEEYFNELLITEEDLEEKYSEKTQILYKFQDQKVVSNEVQPIEVTLNPGTHKLEVWGAQGGNNFGSNGAYVGGSGGYSYGDLTLTEATKIYIYVGEQPASNYGAETLVLGGFNGGGNGYNSGGKTGQGGGGASDIRIGQDSLYARVIVAGGGSGATSENHGYYGGGAAAGEGQTGYGATLRLAGIVENNDLYGSGATFGRGAGIYGAMIIDEIIYPTAGGGGGWYGGGANPYNKTMTELGGGSGWVYTEEYAQYTNSSYTGGTWLLDSKYYLTNAKTVGGNEAILSPYGYEMPGNEGHGAARITSKKYFVPRITGLTELLIQKGTSYDLTSDIEIICATGETGCSLEKISIEDTSNLSEGTHTIYYTVKDSKGKKYKYARILKIVEIYEYTTPQMTSLTLEAGTYKLEVWGAQGGSFDTTYAGGKGGYSYGTLTLSEETKVNVYVGGKGTDGTAKGTFGGGFNGGGQAYTYSATYDMSAGGGSSDIRIITDNVTEFNSLYARVIVAGGGGGAGSYNGSSRYSGGVGGGITGRSGGQRSTSYPAGQGGGIAAAGNSYYGSSNTNSISYGEPASFGLGGSGISGTSSSIAGGGGGWYGGGYARLATGGGGSGWVYTEENFNTWQAGNSADANQYLLDSTYYLTDAYTIAGDQEFTDFDGSTVTGHAGDGAARITKIG